MATALAVMCPCARALATPTTFAANIGLLAGSNILARSSINGPINAYFSKFINQYGLVLIFWFLFE